MQYLQKTFTLPASNKQLTERQYDYATLTKSEFIAKYGDAAEGYTADEVATIEAEQAQAAQKPTASFHPTPPLHEG